MSTQYPVSYLIAKTKSLLLGTTRTQLNQLGASCLATDAQLTILNNPSAQGPGMITAGDLIAIDDELMWVSSVSGASSGSTINVIRGFNSTTAAVHANNAIIAINPYYSNYDIREALKDEIRSWGPQVYAVRTVDLTTTDLIDGYDLGALGVGSFNDWYGPLRVTISDDVLVGNPNSKSWPDVEFEVVQSANTTDFPSGNALIITDPAGIFDSPRTLHLVYAAAFNVDQTNGVGNPTFQDGDDLIAQVGIDYSDLDIPPLGAAWRLLLRSELRRELPESMASSEDLQFYQQTAAVRVSEEIKKERDSRLRDAQIRLKSKYPVERHA